MPRSKAITVLSLATSLFFVPALFAQTAQITSDARPGTINYVEGQATLNGRMLNQQSAGRVEMAPGQTVTTADGKVEVLLTPGVFLRLGDNSAVTMVSPDLTRTEVLVDRGHAEVEVDLLYKQNDLLVDQGPSQTKLIKNGLYEFDATTSNLRVFSGEAAVSPSQASNKWITVKEHHELAINGEQDKSHDFNGEQAANDDPLYNWSKLRADYLGEANLSLAEGYAGDSAFTTGWFWDPAMYSYTWLPADGLLWSPFGFGFYSPLYLSGGGFVYPAYGFRGGFYRAGYGVRSSAFAAVHSAPAFRGGGGFGGGFHGGGGGRR